jgi:phage terminase large subunit-like protein
MSDIIDDIPRLVDYQPTRFMLSSSHYDKAKADRAVTFIENLRHTKGKWAGKPFRLLPWQEQIIRDVFGVVNERGMRQFRTVFIEIGKKNGKSELAAAVALFLLYADNEPSAEVYGAAADRPQASIVFDVAMHMVENAPALNKRSKILDSRKRIVNYSNAGFYQVLSSEVGTKHGLNVSGLVMDEVHVQPNRKLYDVLTQGSGDAREQPLYFLITTAGIDKQSICYELHSKALDIIDGRLTDHSFYPVVYGLRDDEDWTDEKNWYKANPSLGYTITIDRVRDMYKNAVKNPADENAFKQLRLNMWVSSITRFIPEQIYALGNAPIDMQALEGRECYGGLDLSSTEDITAFVLMFPPKDEDDKYIMLPFFWIPEDTVPIRVRRASVPYDIWVQKGLITATEGNVIHYGFIERFIEELGKKYHILEIAFDRWGATQMTQDLEGMGFTVVPFGQGFKDMSPPTKEFYKLLMSGRIIHGGNPVLSWMAGNVVVEKDPAENIKCNKAKSPEKIDGIIAAIMALDRCIRHKEEKQSPSVYDTRGLWVF